MYAFSWAGNVLVLPEMGLQVGLAGLQVLDLAALGFVSGTQALLDLRVVFAREFGEELRALVFGVDAMRSDAGEILVPRLALLLDPLDEVELNRGAAFGIKARAHQ